MRSGDEYYVFAGFRSQVEFRHQDIRTDVPAESFDLVLCRNVVFTYFAEALQRQVLERITEHLARGGYLVVGKHETLPAGTPGRVLCSSGLGFLWAASPG